MIQIRQATLADKPVIFEFLSKAYAEKSPYKFPERWEWQFENNPYWQENGLPIWIAVNEIGQVVGQSCWMVEPLKIESKTYRLSWGVDAYLLPEYRGLNIGYKLLQAEHNGAEVWMALNMAKSSRHIISKLGCKAINPVAVFLMKVKTNRRSVFQTIENRLNNKGLSKILPRVVHSLFLDQLIAVFINIGYWLHGIRFHKRIDPELEIKQVRQFDHNVDILWEKLSDKFYASIQRDSNFLNWKYVQQPFVDYQLLIARRLGQICGYIILRHAKPPENNTGIIADLFVDPDDLTTIHSLLSFAKGFFKDRKVKTITAASSIPAYQSAFTLQGFKKIKDMKPMFKSNIESLSTDFVIKSGEWFLGRSDHDWDQFPNF